MNQIWKESDSSPTGHKSPAHDSKILVCLPSKDVLWQKKEEEDDDENETDAGLHQKVSKK